MDVVFGVFKAQIPDTWVDMSTMTYAIPPQGVGSKEIGGQLQEKSPGNLTITWQPADGNGPAAYLEQKEEAFRDALPRYILMDQGDLADPPDEMPFIIYGFETEDHAVVQIMFVKEIGNFHVIMTGTALAETFSQVSDAFIETAKTVRFLGDK